MRTPGPTGAEHPLRQRRAAVRRGLGALIAAASCAGLAGCARETSQPATTGVVGWRTVGSWSGRADLQTETFTSDTGSFRVHWRATPDAAPTSGSLHVIFRSADSGNPIIDAVNQRGAGDGVASVSAERPRWYYLTIEASDLAWAVRVEEPVFGRSTSGAP